PRKASFAPSLGRLSWRWSPRLPIGWLRRGSRNFGRHCAVRQRCNRRRPSNLVPQLDRRLVLAVLVTEYAYARGREDEQTSLRRRKPDPARGQHSQNMSARKHDRPVIRGAKTGDDAIGARPDVGRLLTIRAPIAEQKPAGALGEDFAGLAPFIIAVVP